MARRLRAAAREAGQQVAAPQGLVRMIYDWERDAHALSERYQLLYATALGIGPDDLARGPQPASPAGAPWDPEPVSSGQVPAGAQDISLMLLRLAEAAGRARGDDLDADDDVRRRELLRILGGTALAGGMSADALRRELDSALSAPTTAADVSEWERVVDEYALDSGRVPPALLIPDLLADLREARSRLDGAPDGLRPPMARVCGQLSYLTATNYLNAGDARSARRYWRTSLRAISQSDDRPAQAMLFGKRAIFGLFGTASSPAASLAYADHAVGIADGIACPGLAEGQAARALALSLLGDHRGSVGAVHDLGDLFARLPGTTAGSVTNLGWSEQKLRFIQGRVYAHAGHNGDATRANDAGVALVPGDTPLPLADFGLNTAAALIRSGDPSEGARHVVRTVRALPPGYQHSAVIRQSAARALDLVPPGAADVPAVAEARELLALSPGTS